MKKKNDTLSAVITITVVATIAVVTAIASVSYILYKKYAKLKSVTFGMDGYDDDTFDDDPQSLETMIIDAEEDDE